MKLAKAWSSPSIIACPGMNGSSTRQLVGSEVQGIGVTEEVAELAQLVQRLARSFAEDGGANARDRETGNSRQTGMPGLAAGRLPFERYQDPPEQALQLTLSTSAAS